jgi:hypothetical protein
MRNWNDRLMICVAATGSLALAPTGLAQNFLVTGWWNRAANIPCGDGGAAGPPPAPGVPLEATFSCSGGNFPETSAMSGRASAGGSLEFDFFVRNGISCGGCDSRPGARAHTNTIGIQISADGQTGDVTASLDVALFSRVDFSVECGNCDQSDDWPYIPSIDKFETIVKIAGNTGFIDGAAGGWNTRTVTATLPIGATTPMDVQMDCQVVVGITTNGGIDQTTRASVRGLTLLGPLNTDPAGGSVGAFGPVFSFPDCPTCTADAPEINLHDNFIYPPGTAPGSLCPWDVNGDGSTDVFDFSELAADFGRDDLFPGDGGDTDYDGDCDVFDFAALASDFGCEP